MKSEDILKEIKLLQNEINKKFDLWLKATQGILKNNLDIELKRLELQEDELKIKYKELQSKEYKEKHDKLTLEYADNKYKVIYKDSSVKYIKHRKDINYKDVLKVLQLNTQENKYSEELIAVLFQNNIVEYVYYNDNAINSIKDKSFYINGVLLNREVRRNGFRYYKNYGFQILQFQINSITDIKYFNDNGKYFTKIIAGSVSKNVDIVCKEDMDKIKAKIIQLRKDKHVKIDEILKEFNLEI